MQNQIFDYARLKAKRDRAARMMAPELAKKSDADFLVKHVAGEICARLAVTNRTFSRAVDLFSLSGAMSREVSQTLPGLEITSIGETTSRDDLALEPQSYDLAFSAFGLHWCNDLPGTLVQIRRALKPDGLFMAALPGEGTLAELRTVLIAAETSLTGGAAMRVDPFIEVRQAGALLQRAGFALPVADTEKLTLRYSTVASLLADLRAIGAGSALSGAVRPVPKASPSEIERQYVQAHAMPDGRLPATMNIIYLTGWSPHESQQKPLRPGSAKTSLADVLKPG
jgi:SAM-dependent methyltransferase